MSGKSVQKKLWNAYGKVAKKLGTKVDVYRLVDSIDAPIQDKYWQLSTDFAFSFSDSFTSTGKNDGTGWINGKYNKYDTVQVNDFIYNSDTGETFGVYSAQLNLPIKVFRLQDRVSIYRTQRATASGHYDETETLVCENYPIWIDTTGSKSNGFVPATTNSFEGIASSRGYTVGVDNTIRVGDILVTNTGLRQKVFAVDYMPHNGITISMGEVQPNA